MSTIAEIAANLMKLHLRAEDAEARAAVTTPVRWAVLMPVEVVDEVDDCPNRLVNKALETLLSMKQRHPAIALAGR